MDILDHMMSSIHDIQHQLVQTDLNFSMALAQMSEKNVKFKWEIRAEVQRSDSTIASSSDLSSSTAPVLGNISPVLSSSVSPPVPLMQNTLINSQDFQNQMLTMLNATFSKLTTIVSNTKTNKTKLDWPKFNGDTKKFKHWYLAIVAQLSLAPWKEFYDFNTNTIVKASSNTSLNKKLYAKLLLCLKGQVF